MIKGVKIKTTSGESDITQIRHAKHDMSKKKTRYEKNYNGGSWASVRKNGWVGGQTQEQETIGRYGMTGVHEG